jgi:uncharacterized membrane protein (UPF0127 family)
MKKDKILVFYIFPFLILTLLLLNIFLPGKKDKKLKTINYKLNGVEYKLLVADDEVEWAKGLMGYQRKEDFDGMLFVFPDKKYRQFWNKNTFLDLDIYWLDDKKIVGKSFLPAVNKTGKVMIINSPKEVNRVIELIVN